MQFSLIKNKEGSCKTVLLKTTTAIINVRRKIERSAFLFTMETKRNRQRKRSGIRILILSTNPIEYQNKNKGIKESVGSVPIVLEIIENYFSS